MQRLLSLLKWDACLISGILGLLPLPGVAGLLAVDSQAAVPNFLNAGMSWPKANSLSFWHIMIACDTSMPMLYCFQLYGLTIIGYLLLLRILFMS